MTGGSGGSRGQWLPQDARRTLAIRSCSKQWPVGITCGSQVHGTPEPDRSWLLTALGQSFRDYATRTRRLIPGSGSRYITRTTEEARARCIR